MKKSLLDRWNQAEQESANLDVGMARREKPDAWKPDPARIGPRHRAILERNLRGEPAPEPQKRKAHRSRYFERKRQPLVDRDGSACYLCGKDLPIAFVTVEHVIPRRHGGTDDDWNLAVACGYCNSEKSDRIVSFSITSAKPVYTSVERLQFPGSALTHRR